MHDPDDALLRSRAQTWSIAALLGAVAICWILLTPPGAGPDEPGHVARAGAVARGDLDGVDVGTLSREAYDLPDSYMVPEPACYAFQPEVPSSCVEPVSRSGATVSLTSRADEYPIWGHLTFGTASLLPGPPAVWWARLAGAAIAIALTTAALVLTGRARPLPAAGVMAASTPMVWSTYALVNPSTFGIAGAVALWATLTAGPAPPERSTRWLFACGWAALALPRRDGLIWACIIVSVVVIATDDGVVQRWRRLGRGPQSVVALSTLATVMWGLTNDSRVSRMVALSPLIILAAELWRRAWGRWATSPTRRAVVGAATAVIGVLGTAVVVVARPGGWDSGLARAVVGQTGTHLVEAVGVLGWLDTSLPELAVIGWVAVVGLLAAAALVGSGRLAIVAAVLLAVTVVTSWVFELYQGNTSGRYWQGRYSLPLLVGIPMTLAAVPLAERDARRLAWAAGGSALALLNVAAWSAARRWGVGIDGSLLPWRWDTHHAPLPPVVVLAAHAAVTIALGIVLFGARTGGAQPQRLTPSASIT